MNSHAFLKHVLLCVAVALGGFAGGLVPGESGSSVAHAAAARAAGVPEGLVAQAHARSSGDLPFSETGLYIVQLVEPSLASYMGGIGNLRATSPQATGAARLDANSPDALAYLDFLAQRQAQFLSRASQSAGRSLAVVHSYKGALNALALELGHDEALAMGKLDGVRAVFADRLGQLNTDEGPRLIGAPNIWDGNTPGGIATRGEGVIIGIIDSGINSQHPAFAATDGDGYTHTNPYGDGVHLGWCASNPGFCNAKLIAAYTFHPNGGSPEDTDGHGSHTASTAGGNRHMASFEVGPTPYNIEISGVAPRANIVAYKVCDPSCPNSSSIAAINSAILNDQVNVLNYSISGSDNPWLDPVDLAFLDASNAGIFVAASAGNTGPGASTVAKTGPWNATVAASTINRVIANTVDVTAPSTPPALQGMAAVPGENTSIAGDISGELRHDPSNPLGCTAFPAGFFAGSLALIQRGTCNFSVKVDNAAAAGASGVIMFNNVGGPPSTMGSLTGTPPALMVDLTDGLALRDFVQTNPGTTVRINAATSMIVHPEWQDIVAGFSSRGPSQYELLKPDFTAPGVNILAAVSAAGGEPVQYGFLQGTSMSSPHAAGAGALLMALNPDWTPAEVRSALATTSMAGLLKEDGVTPATPFDIGSGRLALGEAARVGLVMNETGTNYLAANPATGGDPKTLNQPSMVDYQCAGNCAWARTVRSTLPEAAEVSVSVEAPPGMVVTVTPANFAIAPGSTQMLTIEADVSALPAGAPVFASVRLEATSIGVRGGTVTLLEEDFTGTTFPPAGWSSFKLLGGGTAIWDRHTGQSQSAPASARRLFGNSGDGNQDDWLVTPAVAISQPGATLSWAHRGQWMADYVYSGVWASTGSCNPADGDFVELLETPGIPENSWAAAPVVSLDAYVGQIVCLAFRYGGTWAHTWWIDDVVVSQPDAPALGVADMVLPVVVVPEVLAPEIALDPTALASTQAADTVTTSTLSIANLGNATLDWSIDEVPASLAGQTRSVVLWEQAVNGANGIVSDFFIGSNAGAYSASDFVLADSTTIEFIYAAGFDNSNTLSGQPAINWAIYADNGGVPAGHPEDGTAMASALWSYSAPVNGPGVDITDNDIALDLVAAGQALPLDAGTYWLTVYPSYNVTGAGGARWNWYQAAQVGAQTQLISPVIFGVANWTPLSGLGVTFNDTAFRLEGTGPGAACDNPADVPWLNVAPDNGSTAPGASTDIEVTLDSTGLVVGVYEALLCVTSNDPANPLIEVPVTLTVETAAAPEIELVKTVGTAPGVCATTDAITVAAGTTVYYCYEVTNTGNVTLNLHDLVDDQLGTIFSNLNFALTAGSSIDTVTAGLSIPAVINSTTTNIATWTAYNAGGANEVTAQASATVNVASGAALVCNAPAEGFEADVPPFGWSVQSDEPGGPQWTTIAGCGESGNFTNGTGGAACVSSDLFGSAEMDTALVTPEFSLAGFDTATLSYTANYQNFAVLDFLDVDISTDGGASWTTLLSWNSDFGAFRSPPGVDVNIDLSAYAGQSGLQLRWRYYDPNSPDLDWNWYAQIDDVALVCGAAAMPNIEVDPLSLSSSQEPGTTTTQALNIGNSGEADLVWTIEEETLSAVAPMDDVLMKQLLATGAGSLRVANDASTLGRGTPRGGPAPVEYRLRGGFTEGFDDISALPAQGWFFQNNSAPLGISDWFQGNVSVFPAHAGAPSSYAGANFNNAAGVGTISNWMLTPELNLRNGDTFSFWTRSQSGAGAFPDRLELRLSVAGASTDVGTLATDVGDFTTLLLTVNPDLTADGYPDAWTQYTVTLVDIPPGATGRLAFRYFVTDAGPAGSNSNYIGIDSVEFVSAGPPPACAAPADVPWLSVSPSNGTTTAGASSAAEVSFDSTGLVDGSYEANLCVFSNDPDAGPGNGTSLVVVPVSLTVATPEAPAIELVKTVGTAEGVCGASDAISVLTGTTVYYCYTVTNTGNVTLNLHDLVDDQLGTIFTGLDFALDPGASIDTVTAGLSIPAVINSTTTNTATWTAYNAGGANEVTAQASATVTVLPTTITLAATVGLDPASCATGSAISVKSGATVYYCYTVTNTGEATLGLHDLVDTQLGTIFSGLNFELAPGASVNTVAAGLSLPAVIDTTTTSTATWTAYNAGPVGVATAEASATVTVLSTTITLAATVGTEAGVCAAGSSVTVTLGTPVYWCYTVTNTGEATLNLHDLSDEVSGSILSGFDFALAPGASVNTVAAGLSLSDTPQADLVNAATWTAYNAGPTGTTSAQASTSVTVLFPADVSGIMSVAGDFVEGGEVIYTVLLSNAGPGDQADNPGDEFLNELPATLRLLGVSSSDGNAQASGNQVRWNGVIASGASVSIQIVAQIEFGTAGSTIENQGLISYDSTGDGSNDATRLTDWPETGTPEDPTALKVELIVPIPTLSVWGMLVMMLLMLIFAGYRRRSMSA